MLRIERDYAQPIVDCPGSGTMLLYPFERNDFYFDVDFFLQERVKKAALNFICDQNHVLNSCYETNRNSYRMPRARNNNRFIESFIPFSIQLLNN